MMSAEFLRLMASEGVAAFEMPKSAACAHEAGHAIVETIFGGHVASVEVHQCPQLAMLGVEHAWGGRTFTHGDTGWTISEDTPVVEIRRRVCRLIAGAAGEFVLDPDNVRSGSSLDERAVAQLICVNLHWRERDDGHPIETWERCWDWVCSSIGNNAAVSRELIAKLVATHRVKGKPLDAILRGVRS